MLFSQDICIDPGSSDTRVFVKGKGRIFSEPSVVAVDTEGSGRVVAVGEEAKEMIGRTPGSLQAVCPIRDGVIADFDVATEMLRFLIRKATNNVGVSDDPASVTVTSETLWPFSVREVCGDVTVFADEYGDEIRGRTDYIDYGAYDDLLDLEGEQYAYFAESGVTCSSDPAGTLSLTYGGAPTGWWYRTPYPYAFIGEEGPYFYQVMEGGYPVTLGYASQGSGVAVGLCL